MNFEIFKSLPVLETERLILRPITMHDAKHIFEYARDSRLQRYTTWQAPESIEDSKAFVRYVHRQYRQAKPAPWGVIHKADSKLIGTMGFCHLEPKYQRATVGYVLAPNYWGAGLATEALKEIIKFAFSDLHLNRVEAICSNVNTPSSRVLEKSGMKLEGVLDEYFPINGEMRDGKSYRILRREWATTQTVVS